MMTTMAAGDVVRFLLPLIPEEVDLRFRVIEMRGDRVLVEDMHPFWQERQIRPTAVYAVSMLEVVPCE